MNHVFCVLCKNELSLQHTTLIHEIWKDGEDDQNVVNLYLLMLSTLYLLDRKLCLILIVLFHIMALLLYLL